MLLNGVIPMPPAIKTMLFVALSGVKSPAMCDADTKSPVLNFKRDFLKLLEAEKYLKVNCTSFSVGELEIVK